MTQPTQLQLPDADAAGSVLDQLYTNRFFEKLAEAGYRTQSEQAALSALQTADALDSFQLAPAQADPYVYAEAKLSSFLQQIQPEQSAGLLKQAAEQEQINTSLAVASHLDVYRAVLALKR